MVHHGIGARRLGPVLVAAATAVGLSGCAGASDDAVREAAGRFAAAVAEHDGATACALLTDEARSSAETFGRDCASQLATLPDPGGVQEVEVWSDAAQARLDGDTLFLLRFPDGWRVSAAACTPRGDAPYDCEVQG
jgi:hypothetical protein